MASSTSWGGVQSPRIPKGFVHGLSFTMRHLTRFEPFEIPIYGPKQGCGIKGFLPTVILL